MIRWSDIDLTEGTAYLGKTLSQAKNGVSLVPFTKTDRACTKTLNERMKAAFRAQKALQAADGLHLGLSYIGDPDRPVFTDELGRRLTPKAATNAFARLAVKAGLKTTSLDSTRHTVATTAIRNGADIVTVSRILNQSNPTVTLNIYSHLVSGAEDRTTDVLSEWLDEAVSGKA